MSALAAVYLCCLAGFFIGIAASPGHVFRGWPAIICFFGMCSTGLALAAHAL